MHLVGRVPFDGRAGGWRCHWASQPPITGLSAAPTPAMGKEIDTQKRPDACLHVGHEEIERLKGGSPGRGVACQRRDAAGWPQD